MHPVRPANGKNNIFRLRVHRTPYRKIAGTKRNGSQAYLQYVLIVCFADGRVRRAFVKKAQFRRNIERPVRL